MYANYTGPCTCFNGSEDAVFPGQSRIIAPDGSVLAAFSGSGGDNDSSPQASARGLLCSQLDHGRYMEHRRKNNYLEERRPDIYRDTFS